MAKAVELNQIIGSKYIIVASAGKTSGADGWKTFAGTLATAAEKLRAHNMATGFHNHQVEWKPLEGGERPMDILAKNTPKDVVLQFDAGTRSKWASIPWPGSRPTPAGSRASTSRTGARPAATTWRSRRGRAVEAIFDAAESVGGVEYYLIEQEAAGPMASSRWRSGVWTTTRRC